MSELPHRRRGGGTLGQLKSRLWAAVEYNVRLLEDDSIDHELRLKGSNALVQASLAYCRLIEVYDLEREIRELEQLPTHNGHQYDTSTTY
jgi:hypothetical protein